MYNAKSGREKVELYYYKILILLWSAVISLGGRLCYVKDDTVKP